MDKQVLQRLDSSVSLRLEVEDGGERSLTNSAMHEKSTTFMPSENKFKALLLVFGVLAVIAVSAVVATAAGAAVTSHESIESRQLHDDELVDRETKEFLLEKAAGLRAKRFITRAPRITTCYSEHTNGTYPAARVSGAGSRWNKVVPNAHDSKLKIYDWNTKWVCANSSNAFVDGGMIFNQMDKRLYVPVCGYYHISSQMYFYYRHNSSINDTVAQFVSYEVKVDRACPDEDGENAIIFRSYATIVTTPQARSGKATLHISGVAKICEGGSIRSYIPDGRYNPCCPYGDFQTTYLSAFLVHETSCERSISLDYQPSHPN